MELKELTDKTLELFGVTSPEQLYQGQKMPGSITVSQEVSDNIEW